MSISEISNTFAQNFEKKVEMKKILGIGNALCDVLTQIDDSVLKELGLPKGSTQFVDFEGYKKLNEKLEKLQTSFATGGSVGNTMLALANLGAKPEFIGKVGDDRYGEFYKDNFLQHGGIPHFLIGDLPTGVCSAFITPDGQRTFDDYLGAAATLTADDLQTEWFDNADIFYIEGYLVQNHEMVMRAADIAKSKGLKIGLDFGCYNIVEDDRPFFEQLLQKVDIIFANEDEARSFTGKSDPVEALNVLAEKCEIAIVKIGAEGSLVKRGEEVARAAAEKVHKVVDTTGAGDYFAAGFLYGLSRGESLETCLQKGALLASKVIQVVGTTLPDEVWDEICEKLK